MTYHPFPTNGNLIALRAGLLAWIVAFFSLVLGCLTIGVVMCCVVAWTATYAHIPVAPYYDRRSYLGAFLATTALVVTLLTRIFS